MVVVVVMPVVVVVVMVVNGDRLRGKSCVEDKLLHLLWKLVPRVRV